MSYVNKIKKGANIYDIHDSRLDDGSLGSYKPEIEVELASGGNHFLPNPLEDLESWNELWSYVDANTACVFPVSFYTGDNDVIVANCYFITGEANELYLRIVDEAPVNYLRLKYSSQEGTFNIYTDHWFDLAANRNIIINAAGGDPIMEVDNVILPSWSEDIPVRLSSLDSLYKGQVFITPLIINLEIQISIDAYTHYKAKLVGEQLGIGEYNIYLETANGNCTIHYVDNNIDEISIPKAGGGNASVTTIDNTPFVKALYCLATNDDNHFNWDFSMGNTSIVDFPVGNNSNNVFSPNDEIVNILANGNFDDGTKLVTTLSEFGQRQPALFGPVTIDTFYSVAKEGISIPFCRVHFMGPDLDSLNLTYCISGTLDCILYYINVPDPRDPVQMVVMDFSNGINSLVYKPNGEEEEDPGEDPGE